MHSLYSYKGEGRIMERRTPWLGYLCVILSAVIFGCMPLGANFLYAQGVTPMSLVFLRNLLSLPVLALLCQKQGGLRISRGALLETSLTGFFGCCITPILLFSSYRYLASGMATVFHFAYPVIVVLGGWCCANGCGKKRFSARSCAPSAFCFSSTQAVQSIRSVSRWR
ncbi:DMT family transporter [Ruminococcaceae bacterium AF10-16]|nr:DMT family transporter [Ruminococcaceae bacterium AF10-16]